MRTTSYSKKNSIEELMIQDLCQIGVTDTDIVLKENEPLSSKITNRTCAVCGEDSWCGSDGCPLDPQ
jgi:hypothetical protein